MRIYSCIHRLFVCILGRAKCVVGKQIVAVTAVRHFINLLFASVFYEYGIFSNFIVRLADVLLITLDQF